MKVTFGVEVCTIGRSMSRKVGILTTRRAIIDLIPGGGEVVHRLLGMVGGGKMKVWSGRMNLALRAFCRESLLLALLKDVIDTGRGGINMIPIGGDLLGF